MAKKVKVAKVPILWRERKRNAFGLPWSFTVYQLTEEKLLVSKGVLRKEKDEVLLYRIKDFKVTQTLTQRLFRIGTIECHADDVTSGKFYLVNVRNADDVKNYISQKVEESKLRNRLVRSELIGGVGTDDLCVHGEDHFAPMPPPGGLE